MFIECKIQVKSGMSLNKCALAPEPASMVPEQIRMHGFGGSPSDDKSKQESGKVYMKELSGESLTSHSLTLSQFLTRENNAPTCSPSTTVFGPDAQTRTYA